MGGDGPARPTDSELEAEGAAKDARIAHLEAQGAAKDVRIAELEAQVAAKDARIATLEEQIAMLMKRVGELEERLRQNSRNSHQPPSSDFPAERKQRSHDKSSRKGGGQPGHGGSRRELLPEEQVDEIVDLYPPECENCRTALPKVPDPCASRYQQTEMLSVKPHTTEWRRHQVTGPCCGYKTRAEHDDKVIPQSPFGPRLIAIMAMITGIYHVSRRSAVGLLWDLLGRSRFSRRAERRRGASATRCSRVGARFAAPESSTPTARAGTKRGYRWRSGRSRPQRPPSSRSSPTAARRRSSRSMAR